MKATDGQFLSHQSGGTVAQLRLPAEQRILGARTNIEADFIKAQQIALSLGILHGLWDLGTGMGTRAAADRAYEQGLEDHRFNKRSALPLTVDDVLQVSKARALDAGNNAPNKGGNNTNLPTDTIDVTSSTTGN
jgi:hypothetical protein